MCGIAGYIEFQKDALTKGKPFELLNDMMSSINHRGPDDYGMSLYGYGKGTGMEDPKRVRYFENDGYYAALGHRRLSIIDLSENGRQPMSNSSNNLEIIFNGEIYNYIELREELSDVNFRTQTDTEVLIASYERWGIDMLDKLDGMFAFAMLDRKRNKVLCARDPVGIKPFYYSYSPKGFVFGSEPRTVLKGLGSLGTMDDTSASEFLIMGITDHSEKTFFTEVSQLPCGHWMEIDLSGEMKGPIQYRKIPGAVMPADKDYSNETYSNLVTSVSRQLRADVKLGTSLSGGLDSGTIVSIAGELLKNNSGNYNTLTFSFPGFEDDESKFARSIAESAGMNWKQVIPSTDTISGDLDRMITFMGEPFSTLSMFAQYKIMEHAGSLNIKVMLDGQGGDEIYLGYPRIAQRVLFQYLKSFKLSSFLKEWFGLKKHASISMSRSLLGNVFFSSPMVAINRNKERMKPYVNGEILDSYRKEVADDVYSRKNIFLLQEDELTKYCLPRLLRYADRNSMAFSVESRVPHLSKIMLDYALRLPLNWRVRNGWTKYSIRKAMEGKLPADVLWSVKKLGFPVPQKYWVDKLRDNIQLSLNEGKGVKEFLNVPAIISAIDSGKGNLPHLWRTISLGLWRAKCFE